MERWALFGCLSKLQTVTVIKGFRKNSFKFSHLIFRPSLADPQSRTPRNSSLFLWIRSFGSTKSDLNLSAKTANLFLRKPKAEDI